MYLGIAACRASRLSVAARYRAAAYVASRPTTVDKKGGGLTALAVPANTDIRPLRKHRSPPLSVARRWLQLRRKEERADLARLYDDSRCEKCCEFEARILAVGRCLLWKVTALLGVT